ncbi:hypothetical protein HETIRDRAFT_332471 [Heterobasidion irregulare TC 32-1]|uniref:Uncharacterized protein n=1 Tax=Heterobasidion irregulare (strain TC 32-1) TaxID=747525 RepID=W4JPV5_HETIT|nr:uncharacterized protein HETIRDRAFT_332471 [Heterobasidion irregulare TC 32-1]ETW74906.1 hypothetical protein HETIRDRAFT_332471 [Heterobasidion irregulare TC 32-1]
MQNRTRPSFFSNGSKREVNANAGGRQASLSDAISRYPLAAASSSIVQQPEYHKSALAAAARIMTQLGVFRVLLHIRPQNVMAAPQSPAHDDRLSPSEVGNASGSPSPSFRRTKHTKLPFPTVSAFSSYPALIPGRAAVPNGLNGCRDYIGCVVGRPHEPPALSLCGHRLIH